MYFILTARIYLDYPHFKCLMAASGKWLPYWPVQIYVMAMIAWVLAWLLSSFWFTERVYVIWTMTLMSVAENYLVI